jgi:hypothetical protein
MSGLLVFILLMVAGPPLVRHFGYRNWPQTAKDLYIAFFTFGVVLGSAGAVVGGSFCYSLSRHR